MPQNIVRNGLALNLAMSSPADQFWAYLSAMRDVPKPYMSLEP